MNLLVRAVFPNLSFLKYNDVSKIRVGRNIIANRMTVLNNQINLDWLNLSLLAFKLKVKNLFVTFLNQRVQKDLNPILH